MGGDDFEVGEVHATSRRPDEQAFHRAMVEIYERAKAEAGYNATRFIKLVAERGGVTAARQLLQGRDGSDGFTALWNAGRMDLTVEAHVVKPEFRHLFSRIEVATAERRLRDHGHRS